MFTGGSLLFGATGRTDLVGPEHTDTLTRAQFHSVRRLAAELPADTAIYPTHGFGSFCAATPTSGDASTLAEQQGTNPALTLDEQAYVDTLLAGLDAYPAYYQHMSPVNRRGPAPVDLSAPEPVDAAELRRRIAAGEWVVDLRDRTAFAAGHVAGSLGFELGTNFVTYLGWTIPWGTPLTLIGDEAQQIADAQRELVRIGIDRLAGAATGPVEQLTDARCAPTPSPTSPDWWSAQSGVRCTCSTPVATTSAASPPSLAASTSRCTSSPTASTSCPTPCCTSTAAPATARPSPLRCSTPSASRSSSSTTASPTPAPRASPATSSRPDQPDPTPHHTSKEHLHVLARP